MIVQIHGGLALVAVCDGATARVKHEAEELSGDIPMVGLTTIAFDHSKLVFLDGPFAETNTRKIGWEEMDHIVRSLGYEARRKRPRKARP